MKRAILLLLCSAIATYAYAQTPVVSPTVIEFAPSSNHATADVTRYDIEIYRPTGTTPVQPATGIGKPAPVGNLISYTQFANVIATLPPADYVAKIAAVGPGGTTRSGNSNAFSIPGTTDPCAGGSVVTVKFIRWARAYLRAEGFQILFQASTTSGRIVGSKVDLIETPTNLPAWEFSYGKTTVSESIRGVIVKPPQVGTWPLIIEATDSNGCTGKVQVKVTVSL